MGDTELPLSWADCALLTRRRWQSVTLQLSLPIDCTLAVCFVYKCTQSSLFGCFLGWTPTPLPGDGWQLSACCCLTVLPLQDECSRLRLRCKLYSCVGCVYFVTIKVVLSQMRVHHGHVTVSSSIVCCRSAC